MGSPLTVSMALPASLWLSTSDKVATAIEGLQYLPSSGSNGFGFNGNDTITVLVQDLGGTSSHGFSRQEQLYRHSQFSK